MSIIVFWIEPGPSKTRLNAQATKFGDLELGTALAYAACLRKEGFQHVTISSQHEDCVTLPGVDSVEDGKTPDGQDYTWKKRRL
jgi:hypothetical protein